MWNNFLRIWLHFYVKREEMLVIWSFFYLDEYETNNSLHQSVNNITIFFLDSHNYISGINEKIKVGVSRWQGIEALTLIFSLITEMVVWIWKKYDNVVHRLMNLNVGFIFLNWKLFIAPTFPLVSRRNVTKSIKSCLLPNIVPVFDFRSAFSCHYLIISCWHLLEIYTDFLEICP